MCVWGGGGGVIDLEFTQATRKSVFLQNSYFMDLISAQVKHELITL